MAMRLLSRGLFQKYLRRSSDHLNVFLSRTTQVDFQELGSVCLMLGPYRNLTTLTASIMFLHPECQVLNHGAPRTFPIRRVNFLLDYSDQKFRNFVKYAVYLSKNGRRGGYGGSVTFSHAFDNAAMREAWDANGNRLVKDHIRCLLWKESLHTSNFIRDNHVDVNALLHRNRHLRFLLPIRNPLDCAVSGIKTGHAKFFTDRKSDSVEDVLDCVLREIRWFFDLRQSAPDRFFHFFEHEITEQTLSALARFLSLEPDPKWLASAIACCDLKKGYEHPRSRIEHYRRSVASLFAPYPEIREKLERFVTAESTSLSGVASA
jgi:hypothetical protein